MIDEGLIFDVQRFSVDDGPGIRTTVFFKGCPLRCHWCHNPESMRPEPEVFFYADRCVEQGTCLTACPQGALVRGDTRVDRKACDGCGACDDSCPFGALKVSGRFVSVDALLEEVLRDRPFYASSGGGVTLSGGEPTLQLDFVVALARACRQAGVRVGLQTCGVFSWGRMQPHLDLFEFIHFDLKVIARDRHRELCGADNNGILANARNLVEARAPVSFRMPIIPTHTDDETNLAAVATLLNELGIDRIRLLRYHSMGEAKLPRIGQRETGLALLPRADSSLQRATALLATAGLEVTVS
ncbi:MAG: glycyl-radical enzyme activating protein [Candidatus Krumholzibacteriia bacterium]